MNSQFQKGNAAVVFCPLVIAHRPRGNSIKAAHLYLNAVPVLAETAERQTYDTGGEARESTNSAGVARETDSRGGVHYYLPVPVLAYAVTQDDQERQCEARESTKLEHSVARMMGVTDSRGGQTYFLSLEDTEARSFVCEASGRASTL